MQIKFKCVGLKTSIVYVEENFRKRKKMKINQIYPKKNKQL